jgi:hypothetical protein
MGRGIEFSDRWQINSSGIQALSHCEQWRIQVEAVAGIEDLYTASIQHCFWNEHQEPVWVPQWEEDFESLLEGQVAAMQQTNWLAEHPEEQVHLLFQVGN